jgi:hypothetical protein
MEALIDHTQAYGMELLMNLWLLAAGLCAVLLGLVHVVPGGRELHRPMVASQWPEPAKAVWSVLWHVMTAVLLLGGAALLVAARSPDDALALTALPLALYLVSAALFVGYGFRRLGSVLLLPQWTAFLVISGLAVVGLVR